MLIGIYGAASDKIKKEYIDITEQLCEKLGNRGHSLIYGAGSTGLMGAAARGFHRGGGKVIGVVPDFFTDEDVEPLYSKCDMSINTENMGIRKSIIETNADAFIVLPGGIGTYDEFFEIYVLKQLNKTNKPIALFNILGFYTKLDAFLKESIQKGFLRENALSLYQCYSEKEIQQLIEYIETTPQPITEEKIANY